MENAKEDFEAIYIVNAPFTGNVEEITGSFIMDSSETETDPNPLNNESSCILSDEEHILVENVCEITDHEYAQIVEPDLQQDQELGVFDMITGDMKDDMQQEIEHEKTEAIEESIFLDTKKRKRVSEGTPGFRYQPAEPEIPNGVEVDEFTCPYCLRAFSKVLNKKNHMRMVHNVSVRSKGFIKCNECDIEFLLVNKLRQHLREVHDMEMTQESHRFPNMESFKIWKRNLEKNKNEFFIQQYGPKKRKHGVKWGYLCHRSGKYHPKLKGSIRKRMFPNHASFKMGIYCTCAFTIEERSNEVIVKYWPQHYGHLKDISSEQLSSQEQSTLQECISSGVPFRDLLEDVQENMAGERIIQMALKKRNIKLLKAAFESEEYSPGLTDSESVDRWVNHCLQKDDSPVLYYKQEELESGAGEFILVIMTEFQKQLLVSSDKKVICVDCVHRRKGGRFYLTCISIIDECDVAFPIAFCISNKIDVVVVRSFLVSIRDSTGPLSCTYFMSDNESFYFDSWKEIMDDDSKWLWSMWFFDYNIHIQLRFFRNEILKKAEAYKTLRTLIECQSQSIFEATFKKFLNSLTADPTSRKLGDFLLKRYGANTKHWAYCYRTDLKRTANLQLDVLHRTLRYCCREGRKKRLDKFIFVLMKFVKIKMLDRLTTILDEEKIKMVIEAINECHKEGLGIASEAISSLSDKIWLIKAADEYENVYVTRDYDSCPDRCKLRCTDCDICVHMFSCSCIPSMINANLCQHIHAVVWKFLAPHFSPVHFPIDQVDSEEEIDAFPVWEKGSEMLDSVMKKTHDIYKKIRKHKWDLNNESLNAIMEKLEDLDQCIENCAANRVPPTIERLKTKVEEKFSIKQEFDSNSNDPSSNDPSTSQNVFGPNQGLPQNVQNNTSLPFVIQPPIQQQSLNSNPPPIFYLPNQSTVLPQQNRQPAQPYILIIPHDTVNNAIIPK